MGSNLASQQCTIRLHFPQGIRTDSPLYFGWKQMAAIPQVDGASSTCLAHYVVFSFVDSLHFSPLTLAIPFSFSRVSISTTATLSRWGPHSGCSYVLLSGALSPTFSLAICYGLIRDYKTGTAGIYQTLRWLMMAQFFPFVFAPTLRWADLLSKWPTTRQSRFPFYSVI